MAVQRPDPEAIFNVARQKPPGERAAYLDHVCASDSIVRQRIERLLAVQPEIGSFLESPAPELEATRDLPQVTERAGTVIGPYKLLELIGEGGFGVVFMAEQTQPVRRKVALKVIKPGMDTRHVIARFEAERQALAVMDHPHIARVFDGGETVTGRPFFVMELVRGVPITDYCDQAHLSPSDRLNLFVQVCQAVQHAHQKGIIHRDLKPSNVLVAAHDGRPAVKVIDFGVAKATGHQLTEKTLFTGFAQLIGTPLYMSPEQAAQSPDIDTRSDIYSLGVLLYELLTGTTPFDKERFQQAAYDEIRRIIREEEPARPSTRLSTLGLAAETVSTNRGSEPRKLTALIRGELDWIVMKALEKDRTRRYESAAGLAADVERYLGDEPVAACPPSAAYRLRKFGRRNKAALATAGLVAATVAAAVVGLAVSNVRISREKTDKEAALAEAEANLLLARQAVDEMYTDVASQLAIVPHMQPFQRDVLQKALRFYQEFAQRKSTDPAMRLEAARAGMRVTNIRWTLGQLDACEPAAREAVAALEPLAAERPADVKCRLALAEAQNFLGGVLYTAGRYQEAEGHQRRAAALLGELAAEWPNVPDYRRRLAGTQSALGNCLHDRPGEAEVCHREAVRLCEQLAAERPAELSCNGQLANSYYLLGYSQVGAGRPREAEAAYRRAIGIFEKIGEPLARSGYRATLPAVYRYLAQVLAAGERTEEAERLYRLAVASSERLVLQFPDIPSYREVLVACYLELCRLLIRTGRPDEAAPLGRSALALTEKLIAELVDRSDDSRSRAQAVAILIDLGRGLRDAKENAAAEKALSKALDLMKQLAADAPADAGFQHRLADTYYNLAQTQLRAGRLREAAAAYREALAGYERLAAAHPTDPDYRYLQARMNDRLGLVSRRLPGQTEAALRFYGEAIVIHDQLLARYPDRPAYRRQLANSRYGIGLALWIAGRWADAQVAYRAALATLAPVMDQDAVRIRASIHNDWAWVLATCPDATVRDPRRAVELAHTSVELDPRQSYWNTLGVAEYRAGDYKASLAALEKSMALGKGGDSFDWFFVAMARWQLDNKDEARKWYGRAVEWMAKSRPKDEELLRFRAEAEALIKPK